MNTYRNKENGYLVDVYEDGDTDSESVRFYSQGGGFERKLPKAEFDRLYERAPAPVMQRGTVAAEFLAEGVTLLCWSDGMNWNGSGMPYFDRATVDRLIKLLPRLEWDGDKVVSYRIDDEEPDVCGPTTLPDGSQVWGVGAGYWTWDQVEFDPKGVAYQMGRAAFRKGVKGAAPALDDEFMATLKSGQRLKNTRLMTAWTFGFLDEKAACAASGKEA